MPDWTFWESIHQVRTLARIADEQRIGFLLRGSVAQNLFEAYYHDEPIDSLFAVITPFSDLDFVVENRGAATALSTALAAALPSTGFFRVDIRTLDDLERYRDSNLIIEGQPSILFGRIGRKVEATLHVEWKGEGIAIIREEPARSVTVSAPPEVDLDTVPDLLNDVAYVVRRHPHLMDDATLREIVSGLEAFDPRLLVSSITGHHERRLVFTLVKLLLARVAGAAPEFTKWLDAGFLQEFGQRHPNRVIGDTLSLLEHVPEQGVVAVSVPRPRSRGEWRNRMDRVDALPLEVGWQARLQENEIRRQEEEEPAVLQIASRLAPITVVTDEPDRPGCCLYRDFSRGTLDVGWAGPHGPDLGRFTLLKADEEEFFFAPSYMSTHRGQHSTRIDYGLVCQLSGAARTMYVLYSGVDDA